jgi:ABC-2 type transport system permease protein
MSSLLVQIRREFWEHRALWIAPLVVAALLLVSVAIFGRVELNLNEQTRGAAAHAPAQVLLQLLLFGWSAPFYLAAVILSSIYLLDCLYGERRDRSILFWKSLPVSDTSTVLVKFLVGIALVPLGSFLLSAATSLLASPVLLLRARLHFDDGADIWNFAYWLRVQGLMLYGLLAALLWYAPYAAYLMLASAWARHLPSAWAFIPPLLLALLERMIFGTHYVGQALQRGLGELLQLAFQGGQDVATGPAGAGAPVLMSARLEHSRPDALHLLSSGKLWLGLLAAAALLALAIRIRRYRDDS